MASPRRKPAAARHASDDTQPQLTLAEAEGHGHGHGPAHGGSLYKLSLAALGVVYGDIGTSPLYAFRECFDPSHGIAPTATNIYGILSLIFWALLFTVSIKYLIFILRADNHGEGGIMALLALLAHDGKGRKAVLIALGLFGAALLYGDGVITPAISVLSAVEGLDIATTHFHPFIVPLTVVILFTLFAFQRRGTADIGAVFGPTMLLWFAALSVTGGYWIVKNPSILQALSPAHAASFMVTNRRSGFLVLSAVVLAITGAEALYADLGHFGPRPIRLGWFGIVFPALVLNYFGQGAMVLQTGPSALEHPFYGLVSGLLVLPLVLLATVATVIASQALISGAFSLTQQAIQLGFFPRTHIAHTSGEARGQIYIPQVNRLLMIGAIALVLAFERSSRLAAAYGIAVTGTMIITSVLFYFVTQEIWKWGKAASLTLVGGFLIVDLAFFGANLQKIHEGGWIPILLAAGVYTIMSSWKKGREAMARVMFSDALSIEDFLARLPAKRVARVHGTAIFMTTNPNIAPPALRNHVKHNHVLQERVILMTVETSHEPMVSERQRIAVRDLAQGFTQVRARYGFMEAPDMSEILIHCFDAGLELDINDLTFYLGRETFVPSGESGLKPLTKKLFIILSRNSEPASMRFRLPPDQVIELGSQVAI